MTKNKVLVPIDGSQFSLQIFPYVQRFLNAAENELILFYVAEEPKLVQIEQPGSEDLTIYVDQSEAAIRANFQDEMLPYVQKLQESGFTVSTEVRFGEAIAQIEHFIEEAKIDLVVMTTHGRTGLSRVVLGSVALHLLHHVTVPLMLYRTVSHEAAVE